MKKLIVILFIGLFVGNVYALTDVAPHNMSASNSPSPYVITPSTEYSATFAGWRAFDGGIGGSGDPTHYYWITDGALPIGSLTIDMGFGNAYTVGSYALQNNGVPEPNRMPKNWTFLGSNNGSTWDTLDTVTGETSWGNGEQRTYTCDTVTTAYRYFKIDITANNGDTYVIIGEMYIYQSEAGGATDDSQVMLIF